MAAWSDPWGAEAPPASTLGGLLAHAAQTQGEREAFVDGERRLSHAAVHAAARTVARALLAAGAGKGTRVAVLMGNRSEWVAAAFGAWIAGCVVVPVNTFSPHDEREYVLRHSDAAFLLMQPSLRRHAYLEELCAAHPSLPDVSLPRLHSVFCLDLEAARGPARPWAEFLDGARAFDDSLLDAAADVEPEDDAVIIYTSGTSARPKGVLHVHRGPVLNSFRWAALQRFTPGERIWTTMPFFWSAGLCKGLGAALAAGGCMVLHQWFEPAEVLELLERERVTTVICRAHQEAALAAHPDAARRDLRSLRRSRPDSPLRPYGAADWDGVERGGAYGLTEMCTLVTSCPPDAPEAIRRDTHGRAFPGTVLRIVDPATGAPLPAGVEGEIAVGGTTLMRGYYKRPRAEVFDGAGLFHTGDGGWLDEDGWLHWRGRRTGMIKTAGANVSPVELEQVLARWGRLRLAVALGVPDEQLGEAVVVCAMRHADDPISGDEVREYLRERVASYKVPRAVLFFAEEDVEFTASEKVRPQSIRDFALARLHDMETRA